MRWLPLLALPLGLALAGCQDDTACTTDAQCGDQSACVEVGTQPGKLEKRCLLTCSHDRDCTLSGRFGTTCRPVMDKATGPGTLEARDRVGRANVEVTTQGTIKVCRSNKQVVR